MPDIRFNLSDPDDNDRLHLLLGDMNRNIKQIESNLGVRIYNRGGEFHIASDSTQALQTARELLGRLYSATDSGDLSDEKIRHALVHVRSLQKDEAEDTDIVLHTPRGKVRPAGYNQQVYARALMSNTLTFGIGPAGTGKSFLAVAAAVQALQAHQVERIILVRPAVEAGEHLGFLPGDLIQKVDPYMRPLYDALNDTLGSDRLMNLMNSGSIEIAPLAYMRGRTLNNAFIILDEAQNSTPAQMKMFLTRLGVNSRAVATGDVSQIDLPKGQVSGLAHAVSILKDNPEIAVCSFKSTDVLRHHLVQRIVEAYERDADHSS